MTASPVLTDVSQAAPQVHLEPLLLRAAAAAAVFGVSERHWRRLQRIGRCPEPLDLSGVKTWPVSLLREWCAAGCPTRDQFNKKAAQPVELVRRQQLETPNGSTTKRPRYANAAQ